MLNLSHRDVPIQSIKVGKRFRSDLGDLKSLAASIAEVGLLHPVVIEAKTLHLIAGARRLAACKSLNWETIPARVAVWNMGKDAAKLAERHENAERKDLKPSELYALADFFRDEVEAEHPRGRPRKGGKFPPLSPTKVRDRLGKIAGVSGRTLEKIGYVLDAAAEDPDRYGQCVLDMDRTGKVNLAYNKVAQLQRAALREKQCQEARRAEREAKAKHHAKSQHRANAADPAPVEAAPEPEKAAGRSGLDILTFGDFRVEGSAVGDNSVDFIFTDPPYDNGSVPLYRDLAIFAKRVLRPGGLCMAYASQPNLGRIIADMSEFLTFLWPCAVYHAGAQDRYYPLKVNIGSKPLPLFCKPPLTVWWPFFTDTVSGGREKADHDWQQDVAEAAHFIAALTPPNGLVLDPMAGSGTTLIAALRLSRPCLGFEMNSDTYWNAIGRLHRDAATLIGESEASK
jgi:16S rRNA G966 N2-methylase RsmD